MSIDLNPPTAATPGPTPPPAPPRSSSRAVAIVAICVGGALILGTVLTGVASALWAAGAGAATGSRSADAAGVSALSLDVSAGHVVIAYADVDEATLEVSGGDRGWRLERQGDTLSLSNSRPWWAGWDGWDGTTSRGTLTLPAALADEKLDARFEVSAGSITADGTYGTLLVEVGAGDADVTGSADDLTVDVSAGSADVTLSDVQQGNLVIGAGEIVATLTGTAPDEVLVDVSAGTLVATLPDEAYDVRSDVSVGSLDNLLSTSTGAARTVDVQVSAGDVTLRPLP